MIEPDCQVQSQWPQRSSRLSHGSQQGEITPTAEQFVCCISKWKHDWHKRWRTIVLTNPKVDNIPARISSVDAICRTWSEHHPERMRPDHFGVFRLVSGVSYSCGVDRAIRLPDEIGNLSSFVQYEDILLEFRYTLKRHDGYYSYGMDGRLLEMHSGPEDLFQTWSSITLSEELPALPLNFDETEQAWVYDIENKTLLFNTRANKVKPDSSSATLGV